MRYCMLICCTFYVASCCNVTSHFFQCVKRYISRLIVNWFDWQHPARLGGLSAETGYSGEAEPLPSITFFFRQDEHFNQHDHPVRRQHPCKSSHFSLPCSFIGWAELGCSCIKQPRTACVQFLIWSERVLFCALSFRERWCSWIFF